MQLIRLAIYITLMVTSTWGSLNSDLQEFSALIPRRRIGIIAARYYSVDLRFRKAMEYLRSPAFSNTWRQIKEAHEVVEIANYILDATDGDDKFVEIYSKALTNVPSRFRKLDLPTTVSTNVQLQKSFSSFSHAVMRALPRARIVKLMAQKVKQGEEFSLLYAALRDNEFRQLVETAKESVNLAPPLKELSDHDINVDELIEIGFTVLHWGP